MKRFLIFIGLVACGSATRPTSSNDAAAAASADISKTNASQCNSNRDCQAGSACVNGSCVTTVDLAPQFGYLSPGFAPIQETDMGQIWNAAGLQETGTNYWTSGGPENPSGWSRFDPTSPYYQVWFGSYVIDNFSMASEWGGPNIDVAAVQGSVQRLLALTVADQNAWLAGFLDGNPNTTPQLTTLQVSQTGPRLFSLYVQLMTDSDLGLPYAAGPIGMYPGYGAFATLVPPNAPVMLEAIANFTYDNAHNNFLVTYSSNCHWTLSNGTNQQTPLWLDFQEAQMMAETTFQ